MNLELNSKDEELISEIATLVLLFDGLMTAAAGASVGIVPSFGMAESCTCFSWAFGAKTRGSGWDTNRKIESKIKHLQLNC